MPVELAESGLRSMDCIPQWVVWCLGAALAGAGAAFVLLPVLSLQDSRRW